MKKMRNLLVLTIAVVLVLSFTACGAKVDTTAMVAAFNSTSAVFDETAKLINDNLDKVDEQTLADYKKMSEKLTELKATIEKTDITQEQADGVTEALKPLPGVLKDMKANVEIIIAGNEESQEPAGALPEGVSQEKYDKIAALAAQLDPLYAEAADLATTNGWMEDEKTVAELEAVAKALDDTEGALADPAKFVGMDMDAFAKFMEDLIPMIAPITERVSVPFKK